MVSTIASPTAGSAPTGGSVTIAGLEAQMQRYERQLSDCVYCPSAKTPEGKAAIDKVNEKITTVRLQMEAAQTQRLNKDNQVNPTTQIDNTRSVTDTVGNNIDTFA